VRRIGGLYVSDKVTDTTYMKTTTKNTADTDRLCITEQYAALEEAWGNGELTHEEFRRFERELERELEAQESR
jgi:hypothetical protein